MDANLVFLSVRFRPEKVIEIEIERLRDFKNHPFKVQADSQMKELQESIKKYGILNPLIVRPRPEGFYEIISGHKRKYAAQQLKYTKVPVIIRYMLEEDAIISMVDANLQRERISPSEKAFAYKMKYDVLKRKAGRRKCSQVDYLTGKKSVEVISEECGDRSTVSSALCMREGSRNNRICMHDETDVFDVCS